MNCEEYLVKAYKCPFTGKLFDINQKDSFKRHYTKSKKLKEKRDEEKIQKDLHKKKMNAIFECRSIEEIRLFILDNTELFVVNGVYNSVFGIDIKAKYKNAKFTEISFSKIYEGMIPNSHSCPRNGVTNFDRRRNPHLPTSYLGVNFCLSGKISNYSVGIGIFDMFKNTGIDSGSGSGGYSFQFEAKIFYDDFPHLMEDYNSRMVEKILSND